MKIKTLKEYKRDLKKCKYCGGTGQDIFNKSKTCPNCTNNVEIIMSQDELDEEVYESCLTLEEKLELIDEKINWDIFIENKEEVYE